MGSTRAETAILSKSGALLAGSAEMDGVGTMGHMLFVVPVVGFVVAAGTGIFVRARRTREDRRFLVKFSPPE